MEKRKMTAGFTLVELIVIIAILGILAGVGTVGYSGYIKKADQAADEQLLASLNTAFASACISNNVNQYALSADTADITLADGKVDTVTVNRADFTDAFNVYYDISEGGAFKTVDDLYFRSSTHMFAFNALFAYDYAGTTLSLSSADLAALGISSFITADGMSVDALMGQVGNVVDFAAAFGSGVYDELFVNEDYLQFMCDMMGVDPADYGDSLTDAYDVAIYESMVTKVALDAGVSVDTVKANWDEYATTYGGEAMNYVMANTAVLYSAHNATKSTDEIMASLAGDSARQDIIDTLKVSYGDGLTQASVAYGMYMAYAYSEGDTAAIANVESGDYMSVLNDLDNGDFQDYLETSQAQTDLEAYLSSMNMINNNAGNSEAVTNLLANGFADDELITLFKSALSSR